FKGTRVLVKDVLWFLAEGKSWDWISDGYHGLPHQAIAEAARLAGDALIEKTEAMRQTLGTEQRRAA
ncbi:MAG: DUF433 domain-containing protein, partial [Blastocatellia bacterium]